MQLERQPGFITGIICDLCGSEHENDFTYYSADVREVAITNNRNVANLSNLPIIFSFEVCTKCITEIGDIVKVHYIPTSVGINCDLCGCELRGDFTFYYTNVSEVNVEMSSGRAKCHACGAPAAGDGPCKCGDPSAMIVRFANMNVNDKYLQVVLCPDDYKRMTQLSEEIRCRAS